MSLKLISQLYEYDSDDVEVKSESDIKGKDDEKQLPREPTTNGNIKTLLELTKVKNHKSVRNKSKRNRKEADIKEDSKEDDEIRSQPKNSLHPKGQRTSTRKKKAKTSDPIHKFEKVDDRKTVPDLNMQLPFNHCKIVFRLEVDDDDANCQMPHTGWERQRKEFIFHDVVTHQEMARLERYARKRELSSRPCPKSRQRHPGPGGGEGMSRNRNRSLKSEIANDPDPGNNSGTKEVATNSRNCTRLQQSPKLMKFGSENVLSPEMDYSNNDKILQEHTQSDGVHVDTQDKENVEEIRILSKAVNEGNNGNTKVAAGYNDGDDDKRESSCPIILESEKMDDSRVAGMNQIPLLYRCPFCLEAFNEGGALVKHLSLHSGKISKGDGPAALPYSNANLLNPGTTDPLLNEECEGSLRRLRDQLHLPVNPDIGSKDHKIFNCPKCPYCSKQLRDLERHMIIHQNEGRPFKCSHCPSYFRYTSSLTAHKNKHHPLEKISTRKEIARVDPLCKLPENQPTINPNIQDRSGLTWELDEELKPESENKTTKEKVFKLVLMRCDILLKQYGLSLGRSQFVDKTYHSIDLSEKGMETPPKTAGKGVGISEHIETIQSNGQRNFQRKFKCKLCEKLFGRRSDVARHIRSIHKQEKRFKCASCHKEFFYCNSFERHQLVHSGLKPHKCHLCLKTFPFQHALQRHFLTHSGIKPFNCNLCSKTFSIQSSLKRHLLTHSGVKTHNCSMCPIAFSQRDNLKRHLLTHKVH